MSVSKWAWTEECEGKVCCGECDLCSHRPGEERSMTREEAIQVLKRTIAYESDFAEAKRMAIEALSEPSGDLISRADAIEALCHNCAYYTDAQCKTDSGYWCESGAMIREDIPSAELPKGELISRADAICEVLVNDGIDNIVDRINALPSAEAVQGWNNHEIACMLAELFGDDCACNCCGIDEWLPYKCELDCPYVVGVACWEQFVKHYGERKGGDE